MLIIYGHHGKGGIFVRLGLLTNCFRGRSLLEIADWAHANGFSALEVGPHIQLDADVFRKAQEKIEICALIYCRNFFDSDPAVAEGHVKNLKARIEFAIKLNIPLIVTSTGIVEGAGYEGSIDRVVGFFEEMVELIGDSPLRIAFENCPAMGNIAISPYMWSKLFEKLPPEKFGLAYDPSHLVWQLIDPYRHIEEVKDRIFHVHAKDTQVRRNILENAGILMHRLWWKHRLPGLGDIDWDRMIETLRRAGYDGIVSVEHEDPEWEGSYEKVERGLLMTHEHLARLV